MLKKLISIFIISAVSFSCLTSAFAAENSETINSNENMNTLTLIEDNGQSYEEEIINVNGRESGSYETTFSIKGGVYTKQSWNVSKTPTFSATITTNEFEGADLGLDTSYTVYLEKKGTLGYAPIDEGDIAIEEGYTDTVTLEGDGKGTYRIYVRNWSGFEASGNLNVKFNY